MLGHPTGRLLLEREAYAVNLPQVIATAAKHNKIIEINAHPYRLDMDWRLWKHAKELGVKCAINPDAHNIPDLQFLGVGVGIARKGWLTKADVINCLPLKDVEMALLDVIARGSNGTLDHAAEYLAMMKKQKRYQRDVY